MVYNYSNFKSGFKKKPLIIVYTSLELNGVLGICHNGKFYNMLDIQYIYAFEIFL